MFKIISTILMTFAVLSSTALASAHVVVAPAQANVGQELVFSVSSPNEQQTAMVSLKLDVPKGITGVVPTAKVGWTITTDGIGDDVRSITWSAGELPVAQRDDFSFSAQVPAKASQVAWKAYQTYADGTVMHWDQQPAGSDDATGLAGPYSVTKVVNDLASAPVAKTTQPNIIVPVIFSLGAVGISIAGVLSRRKP
jgi:uncharacterized protein YcnI